MSDWATEQIHALGKIDPNALSGSTRYDYDRALRSALEEVARQDSVRSQCDWERECERREREEKRLQEREALKRQIEKQKRAAEEQKRKLEWCDEIKTELKPLCSPEEYKACSELSVSSIDILHNKLLNAKQRKDLVQKLSEIISSEELDPYRFYNLNKLDGLRNIMSLAERRISCLDQLAWRKLFSPEEQQRYTSQYHDLNKVEVLENIIEKAKGRMRLTEVLSHWVSQNTVESYKFYDLGKVEDLEQVIAIAKETKVEELKSKYDALVREGKYELANTCYDESGYTFFHVWGNDDKSLFYELVLEPRTDEHKLRDTDFPLKARADYAGYYDKPKKTSKNKFVNLLFSIARGVSWALLGSKTHYITRYVRQNEFGAVTENVPIKLYKRDDSEVYELPNRMNFY